MEWVEITGKSVLDAKEAALDRLGVHEEDAEFEVVTEEKTGMFGRLKEEARVRARVRPTTPRGRDDRRKGRGNQGRGDQNRSRRRDNGGYDRNDRGGRGGQGHRNGGDSRTSNPDSKGNRDSRSGRNNRGRNEQSAAAKTNEKQEQPMSEEASMPLPDQADLAQEFVAGLAERFGTSVSFERDEVDENEIRLTVNGDKLGRMIGPMGAAASAIDELVRTVLQRHSRNSRDGRVRVDIGGVRARRADALAKFCRSQAAAVRESGVARSLEPMGGADRKLVHDTISFEDGVDTISEGEDANRRVVIVPAGDAA